VTNRRLDWDAVNALFADLVNLPPEEQQRRLEAFAGPPHIRAEVASLLAALRISNAGQVSAELNLGASQLTLAGARALLAASLVGQRLGPWAVVREIGRGGMGTVYEAFRADDQYRKRVAVKTLTRASDGGTVARRFQQERQILASLDHPHIATLIDGGLTTDGFPYLVMEFVDGEPIDRYCTARRLGLRARLDLFRQVASAVEYAHRNLVVHRDLKPSNVLVTADGTVKLVDFGIAKLLGGGMLDHATLTETGGRAFTTAYASPEQIRGDAISTATDVYSLGVMLYLLLTGKLPIDITQLTPGDALRRIAEDPPPPPSRVCTTEAAEAMGLRDRNQLARALRGELDDIVLAAIRKEPERRYGTVAAFSDDVKRYLQGQQVSARPDTWRYRARTFVRRNPRLAGMAVVTLLALAAGASGAAWQAQRAALERDRARAEAARSARVVAFLEQTLATPVRTALTEATIALIDRTVSRAATELPDEPLARAAIYRAAANAYTFHNHTARALPLLDSAMALHRTVAGPASAEVGRDLTVAARLAYSRGLMDSAVHYSAEAVHRLRARPHARAEDLATALLYHSFALTYAGRAADAIPIAEEGARGGAAPLTLRPYFYMALGEAYFFTGRSSDGEAQYQRALALYDSLPLTDPPERGIAELGVASALINRGAYPEAERHVRRALRLLAHSWGPDHAYTARARALLARIAYRRGDRSTAASELAAAEAALAGGRLSLVDLAAVEAEVARIYLASGRAGEGVSRLEHLLHSRAADLAHAPQLRATLEATYGSALTVHSRPADAVPVLLRALDTHLRSYGDTSVATCHVAATLLFAAVAAGDTKTATYAARYIPADSAAAIQTRARRSRSPRQTTLPPNEWFPRR
jgi:serine/threonine-protein kinase